MSELSTEVRAQNLAHSVALRKQLNNWYKEQHIAVHKLSHGQQKVFRNLIKVQNDKRRIERQTHIKKQEELRQTLRERAQKQKEEALKKAMELDMLSLAIGVTNSVSYDNKPEHDNLVKKSTTQKLPKIKEITDFKSKTDGQAMGSKRKHERSISLEPLDPKRPTRSSGFPAISKMNKSEVLPVIQNGFKDYSTPQTDFDIIAAVSEANGIEEAEETNENLKDISHRAAGALSTPHFQQPKTAADAEDDFKNDDNADMVDKTNEDEFNTMWTPSQSRTSLDRGSTVSPSTVKIAIVRDTSSPHLLPELNKTPVLKNIKINSKQYDKDKEKPQQQSHKLTNNNMNSNQVLPPITSEMANANNGTDNPLQLATHNRKHSVTSSTKSVKKRRKLKERQSLIDDMHRYHISIADTRRYTIPKYEPPVVESVVKYTKTSQGSFVSSDVAVKPAANDFKLPSKKSQYLLEKALRWEQAQVEPRQTKLEHFYGQVSDHIDKSNKSSIPKPKVTEPKDTLPAIKLKTTIHSRTFGNSLEGFHLQQDVHDLRNCRYLRFKGTSLPQTLADSEQPSNVGPYRMKSTSWGQAEVSRYNAKHAKKR
ncbi:uncharacterized protein [Amphiura filiformis]|uniref:uncharacterized protein n=1 Tax=Amphiura filiformis TaxID=82378 RepID=UPI003B215A33